MGLARAIRLSGLKRREASITRLYQGLDFLQLRGVDGALHDKTEQVSLDGDLQPDLARCCGINDALIGRCPFSLVDHLAEKRRKRVMEEEPPTFRFGCGPPIEALHDCLRVACQAVRVPKVGDERMI